MKHSLRKTLIPGIALLLVSVLALSGASYAWFTLSRTVTATGITLTITAPNNLVIANTVDGTYSHTATKDEDFGTGRLYAASSLTGAEGSFFAASQRIAESGAPTADTLFLTGTEVTPVALDTDGYYADFSFWIKTSGLNNVGVTISHLTTGEHPSTVSDVAATPPTSLSEAVRVAVLRPDGTLFDANTENVYAFGNADYFAGINGPIATLAGSGWQGVADTHLVDGLTTPPYDAIFTVLGGPDDSANPPIEILVRVWIEGQDRDCISSNAKATFNLQLSFSDVTYINGVA